MQVLFPVVEVDATLAIDTAAFGTMRIDRNPNVTNPGKSIIIGIRPEHLRACADGQGLIRAKLELYEHLGEHVLVHMLTEDGMDFIAKMEAVPETPKGGYIEFTADPALVHTFDKASGLRT